MSTTTILTANRRLDNTIVNTRYWKVGSASTVSANANNDLYIGITSDYVHRRSRIIFYPNKNNFTNETITSITLTVNVKDLFSSSAKTAQTAIRYSSTNANTDEAYNAAALITNTADFTTTGEQTITITDSAIINNISTWCKNGTAFSFYFGRGDNNDTKQYGIQISGYTTANPPKLSIEHIPSASTGTISSNPTIGSNFTINIARASSSYSHKIIIQSNRTINNTKKTITSSIITETSYTFKINESDTSNWIANGASSQSNTKLTIETYSGETKLGSYTTYFTLYANANPVVAWDTASVSAKSGTLEALMSGYGNLTLKLEATPVDGDSSISYFRVQINSCNISINKKYTASNNSKTITDIPKPYVTSNTTLYVNVYAINNRGKESAVNTLKILCYAYNPPGLSSLKIIRASDTDGTPDLMGAYIYGTSALAITTSGGNSFQNISVSINNISTVTIVTKSPLKFYADGGTSAAEKEYTVTITIADKVTSNTITTRISSSKFIFHVAKGGKSLGLGSAAGANGTIKLGWKLLVNNGIEFTDTGASAKPMPVSLGGTGSSSASGALNKLGAISKEGDTMTGALATPIYRLYFDKDGDKAESLNVISYNIIDGATDLKGNNIHRVFLGTTNQRTFIVSGTDPIFYKRNFAKDGSTIDNTTYTFLHSGNYSNYINSHLYYPKGKIITLDSGILFGYSTSSTTEIRILIPLPKSLEKITSVSFSNFKCAIRDGQGYAIQKSWGDGAVYDYINFINSNETKILQDQQAILVQLDASTAKGGPASWYLENNRTLSVHPNNIKFTLN